MLMFSRDANVYCLDLQTRHTKFMWNEEIEGGWGWLKMSGPLGGVIASSLHPVKVLFPSFNFSLPFYVSPDTCIKHVPFTFTLESLGGLDRQRQRQGGMFSNEASIKRVDCDCCLASSSSFNDSCYFCRIHSSFLFRDCEEKFQTLDFSFKDTKPCYWHSYKVFHSKSWSYCFLFVLMVVINCNTRTFIMLLINIINWHHNESWNSCDKNQNVI